MLPDAAGRTCAACQGPLSRRQIRTGCATCSKRCAGAAQADRRLGSLIGRTFNSLTVEAYSHSDHNGRNWLCRCACGKTVTLPTGRIVSDNDRACGCRRAKYTHLRDVAILLAAEVGDMPAGRALGIPWWSVRGFREVAGKERGQPEEWFCRWCEADTARGVAFCQPHCTTAYIEAASRHRKAA